MTETQDPAVMVTVPREPTEAEIQDAARHIYASLHHLMRVHGTEAQRAYESAGRSILRAMLAAAPSAPSPGGEPVEVQYEVWQHGQLVAATDSLSEGQHYAMVYRQDDPVELKTSFTRRVAGHVAHPPAEDREAPRLTKGQHENIAWFRQWLEEHLDGPDCNNADALIGVMDILALLSPDRKPEGDGWRSMDSAPKDCVFIIGYDETAAKAGRLGPGQRVYEARWCDRQQTWTSRNGFCLHTDATHWRPLPDAPQGEG